VRVVPTAIFHPLTCCLDESGEALAAELRPGNAGANTAGDHLDVLLQALEQLPERAWGMPMRARADSGGATHEFVTSSAGCRSASRSASTSPRRCGRRSWRCRRTPGYRPSPRPARSAKAPPSAS
jgi:hypothetical protein